METSICYDKELIEELFCTWDNYQKQDLDLSFSQWSHKVREYNAILCSDGSKTVCITLYKPRGYKVELHTYFLTKPSRELLEAHDETLKKVKSMGYSCWFTYCTQETSIKKYLTRKYGMSFNHFGYGEKEL